MKGTVVVLLLIDTFLPNFDLFHQCFTLDCLFYAASTNDSVIRFLPSFLKLFFFFKVSPVLPISFSRNEIPGKYKYSNI